MLRVICTMDIWTIQMVSAHLGKLCRIAWEDGFLSAILGIQVLNDDQRLSQFVIAICITPQCCLQR